MLLSRCYRHNAIIAMLLLWCYCLDATRPMPLSSCYHHDLCSHHNATVTMLPLQCYLLNATITIPPSQCYFPDTTIPMLAPWWYRTPKLPVLTLPSQLFHHNASITMLPSQCYHHNATVPTLPSQHYCQKCYHCNATILMLLSQCYDANQHKILKYT